MSRNKITIINLLGNKQCKLQKSSINTKKELSSKDIESIHSRGHITPDEWVNECEQLGVCAPGDIGYAKDRCKKFNNNCHECLKDFADNNSEYSSLLKDENEIKQMKLVINA